MLLKKSERNTGILDEVFENGSVYPPLRKEAAAWTDDEKVRLIAGHFEQIMLVLGLDVTDDSLQETPARVARMYVNEIFSGLNPLHKPEISVFENKYGYDQMLVEKNITLYSYCEHHFVPIIGKVHVAYYPADKVIGLSKINRIVEYCAKRPQVQERLTVQIAHTLEEALGTNHIAVLVDATHLCVASRGVRDIQSSTVTSYFGGKFRNEEKRNEFMNLLKL